MMLVGRQWLEQGRVLFEDVLRNIEVGDMVVGDGVVVGRISLNHLLSCRKEL